MFLSKKGKEKDTKILMFEIRLDVDDVSKSNLLILKGKSWILETP